MRKMVLSALLLSATWLLVPSALAGTYALPAGDSSFVSSTIILPPVPRQGIVINLSEMRLYYFPAHSDIVMAYSVGIGKVGKTVPTSKTYISKKVVNPTWTPTPDIRKYNQEKGIILPANIPPGPDNPLGPYALYLGSSEYRIHSTIFPESIGRRASFGCIRMTEPDIKDFFPLVSVKTPVNIVDMPTILGWSSGKLFMEAYAPLEEAPATSASYDGMVNMIDQAVGNQPVLVDWQLVSYLAAQHDGVPHEIGVRVAG